MFLTSALPSHWVRNEVISKRTDLSQIGRHALIMSGSLFFPNSSAAHCPSDSSLLLKCNPFSQTRKASDSLRYKQASAKSSPWNSLSTHKSPARQWGVQQTNSTAAVPGLGANILRPSEVRERNPTPQWWRCHFSWTVLMRSTSLLRVEDFRALGTETMVYPGMDILQNYNWNNFFQ